jgi:ribosomal protein L37AE/L43A
MMHRAARCLRGKRSGHARASEEPTREVASRERQGALRTLLRGLRLGEDALAGPRSVTFAPVIARKEGCGMKTSLVASRPDCLICPRCEAGKLHPSAQGSMTCLSCRSQLGGAMLETLRRIAALPDVLGSHACECGHPEMRRLPDGTFHCPACGLEIRPIDASST